MLNFKLAKMHYYRNQFIILLYYFVKTMKGVLTITIQEEAKVEQTVDQLISRLKLTDIIFLHEKNIVQNEPKYSLQFNTNLSLRQLLAEIKNYSKIQGFDITFENLDSKINTSHNSKQKQNVSGPKQQSSQTDKASQKTSILRQLEYLQNSQDSETEQLTIGDESKFQMKANIALSDIKSDDQFQILQVIGHVTQFKDQAKNKNYDKKQSQLNEAPASYIQQGRINQSKQEVMKIQLDQPKQQFKISEQQYKNQQKQSSDNQEASTQNILKYSQGKDDYSTVFKIQPQDNNQEKVEEIAKQTNLEKNQYQQEQDKKEFQNIIPQKVNIQSLLHELTTYEQEVVSVLISAQENIQTELQVKSQIQKEVQLVALNKQKESGIQPKSTEKQCIIQQIKTKQKINSEASPQIQATQNVFPDIKNKSTKEFQPAKKQFCSRLCIWTSLIVPIVIAAFSLHNLY